MNKKVYYSILAGSVAVALLYNLYMYPNALRHDLTQMYIRIAQSCQKAKFYEASNFYFKVAKNITPDRKTWYDYNIAQNLRSEFWGVSMSPLKQKKLHEALNYLDSESKNFPDHLDILAEYAYIYYQLEDYDKAIEYYEKCINKSPKWEYGLSQLSHIYGLVKYDYNKSTEYADRALAVAKNKDDLYFRKGWNYMRLEKYQDAAKMFELYLKNNPKSVAALVNITACEIKNKNFDKAEEYVNRGLDLNRYSSYLLESKIDLLIHNEKYDEAKTIIDEMIARDEYDGYIGYYERGKAEKKQGNSEEADKYFEMARKNAQEYYDKFCEKNYDLSDSDGNCSNRFKFLDKFDENLKKPMEL